MAGKTVDIASILTQDTIGTHVASKWCEWDNMRANWKNESREIREYLFATDTKKTSNSKLPWKNTTTRPKLTQIRDNLIANYIASLFPKRKWLFWKGGTEADGTKEKRDAIEKYIEYAVQQPEFIKEITKVLTDYIDDGNCFVSPEWLDQRITLEDGTTKVGYAGPTAKRISPHDIVFNPIANNFISSPKIVRVIWTMGEVRNMLDSITTEESKDTVEALWTYLTSIRQNAAANNSGGFTTKDHYLNIDGFDSYASYLTSGYCELLFFFGDLFDITTGKMLRNHKIIVADRHKVISQEINPSFFGYAPIHHGGWRVRQDNLWAMSPLANIVGMQYRIDHLENMKADILDLVAYPVIKVKGYVEDFVWQPLEKIICGDDGDVDMVSPNFQAAQLDDQIARYEEAMEISAGSPKEAMGFRNPGEKTMYEVQRLENAYNRIFQSKISQFEINVLEPLLNGMLDLARRKMDVSQNITIFDDELKVEAFQEITPKDISGTGRLFPLAARNFAERAEILQNLNTFANSALWQDQGVRVHFSGIQIAEMLEEMFNLEDYKIVQQFVQIAENADAQRMMQSAQEEVMVEGQTPAGLAQDDSDQPFTPQAG